MSPIIPTTVTLSPGIPAFDLDWELFALPIGSGDACTEILARLPCCKYIGDGLHERYLIDAEQAIWVISVAGSTWSVIMPVSRIFRAEMRPIEGFVADISSANNCDAVYLITSDVATGFACRKYSSGRLSRCASYNEDGDSSTYVYPLPEGNALSDPHAVADEIFSEAGILLPVWNHREKTVPAFSDICYYWDRVTSCIVLA